MRSGILLLIIAISVSALTADAEVAVEDTISTSYFINHAVIDTVVSHPHLYWVVIGNLMSVAGLYLSTSGNEPVGETTSIRAIGIGVSVSGFIATLYGYLATERHPVLTLNPIPEDSDSVLIKRDLLFDKE